MQTTELKVAIIGAGNMGGAIARGMAAGKLIPTKNIYVSNPSQEKLDRLKDDFPEINVSTSNVETARGADIIIFAVKPWYVESVISEIRHLVNAGNEIFISIAAGVSLTDLSKWFDVSNTIIFRVIPNIAIEIGQSVSTISSLNASPEQQKLVVDIFSELGKTFVVPESQMNAFMSLTSCGIAFACRYIRAAMEGAVEMGIYPDVAKEAVIQTLRGTIGLLEAPGSHPEVEIDKVTTPGGITIKGLNEMEANGFTNAVIKGLKASGLNK
ncbi:pyrroline-5-carboxylate reductase [Paludibacter sp. 221]|uniref:pyrroline-5-carboxylate reductase n=1 Tax=Paludibacter sp. 221 TaxID=2302939 RepID=UPI0013D7FD5C|nr:pyrroline-5-carboxylate reductase [Paludibacter sp. 221]NDV47531.1 pyrroline-5-carboxylate reductase [Paludibacter sp. 221]